MYQGTREKIAIFVCNDLLGILLTNRVVPAIKELDFEPIIFNTGLNRNRQFKIPTPPIVAFYNAILPTNVIIPALESQPIVNSAPNHTYRQLAALHGIEYREIENVNDSALVNEIVGGDYRGGIAMRFLQVFEKEIISIFHERGFLWNLHSGLLPDYAGLLTPPRAIENGEKTYGLTLHDLTCGIDVGAIVEKGELPLDCKRPILDLYLDTLEMGAGMVLRNLAALKAREPLILTPQDNTRRKYYPNPTSEEFARYASKGIIYADESAIERIAGLFAHEGTLLNIQLKKNIQDALAEQTLPLPVQPIGNINTAHIHHLQL